MKIVVITDVHANLPALLAALNSINKEGYDAIFHTGDTIAIRPYPAECLDSMLCTLNIHFVKGNHETCFVNGLPTPKPAWMSDSEMQHQMWTHSRLDPQMVPILSKWPYFLKFNFEGVKTTFVHYGQMPSSLEFQPVVMYATAVDLDRLFALHDAELVFYGHDHRKSDLKGQARYINLGSLGCCNQAIARYCVVEFHRAKYKVENRHVPYDDSQLFKAFERHCVPDRKLIYSAFFGGRYRAE